MPKGLCSGSCCQYPHCCGEPLLTHASTGDSPTLGGGFGSVSYGLSAPLFLFSESWCTQGFVCVQALQAWNLCFPQTCGCLVIKSHWASRSESLGTPSLFFGSLGWEAWWDSEHSQAVGELPLALLFSSLCITYRAGMGFDFIMIVPILPPHCGFFFAFGLGVSFLVGSSILLSMVVQQLAVILVLSPEEMNICPSTLPSSKDQPDGLKIPSVSIMLWLPKASKLH